MKHFQTLVTITLLALCSQALQTRLLDYLQLQFSTDLRISSRSKLPLFIHDLRHDWIEENIAWLERRPDLANDLCVANSALRNEEIEGRTVPTDLFDRLEIDNNRFGINRKEWINMRDRLKEISKCPVALQQVTYLYMDVYVDEDGLMDPGEKNIQLLADVLSAMPNLKRLSWGIPAQANKFFDRVFAQQGLQLPSVTHLVVGALAQHMVSICPNLEKLEGGSYYHHWSWSWSHGSWDWETDPAKLLLQEASRAPTIVSLSFQAGRHKWNRRLVRDVLQAFPNLTNLTMIGDIGGDIEGDIRDAIYGVVPVPSSFLYEPKTLHLKYVLDELKSAPHLSHLDLPEAPSLDLGFDGGHFCGNAYEGEEGREYGRQVSRQFIETVEEAANAAFEILPHLKSLRVGGISPVDIIRDGKGHVVEVKWVWTGRIRAYLDEIWPEADLYWNNDVLPLI